MIIVTCGFAGSGKDTIGNFLVKEYGYIKLSFAFVLKEVVALLFNWDLKMLQGDTVESREWREQIDTEWSDILNMEITPRKALQLFGTESCRNVFGENIFSGYIKIIIQRYINQGYTNLVITDCRFKNEYEMLKSYDAKIIHVFNKELDHWFYKYKYGDNAIKVSNGEKTTMEYIYETFINFWYPDYISEMKNMHPSEYEWIRNDFDYELKNTKEIIDLEDKVRKFIKYYN